MIVFWMVLLIIFFVTLLINLMHLEGYKNFVWYLLITIDVLLVLYVVWELGKVFCK